MLRRSRTSALLIYFIGACLLLWLKSPDALVNPQFWAEDGPIFFKQQFAQAWPPLLEPYSGYLHVAPRLVAWAATAISISHAPAFYNLSAILIDALCIALATSAFGRYFGHAVVFLSFFIVPSVGDIFGTVTNVQWFMQFVLAAACFLPVEVDREYSRLWRSLGYSGLLIAAVSGPFSILITALACGAIGVSHPALGHVRDNRWDFLSRQIASIALVGKHIGRWLLFIVAWGACIQLAVVMTHNSATPWGEMQLSRWHSAERSISKKSSRRT